MTDYNAVLSSARRKLCQIRDRRKAMNDLSHGEFYHHVSQIIRSQSGVRLSPAWLRAQCEGETEPSFLRFGALLNFLEDFDEDGVTVTAPGPSPVPVPVPAPAPEESPSAEPVPDLDSPTPFLDKLRAEHAAGGGYKLNLNEPNPLMREREAAKNRRRS